MYLKALKQDMELMFFQVERVLRLLLSFGQIRISRELFGTLWDEPSHGAQRAVHEQWMKTLRARAEWASKLRAEGDAALRCSASAA